MHIRQRKYLTHKKLLATIIAIVALSLAAFLAFNPSTAKYIDSFLDNFNLSIIRETTEHDLTFNGNGGTFVAEDTLSAESNEDEVIVNDSSTTNDYYPFYPASTNAFSYEMLETMSEADRETYKDRKIKSIAFKANTSSITDATWKNLKIYLGNTSKTTFSNTTGLTISTDGSTDEKIDGFFDSAGSITFGSTESGWQEITLDKSFEYNGAASICVAIFRDAPTTKGSFKNYTKTVNNSALYKTNQKDPTSSFATKLNVAPTIKLTFEDAGAKTVEYTTIYGDPNIYDKETGEIASKPIPKLSGSDFGGYYTADTGGELVLDSDCRMVGPVNAITDGKVWKLENDTEIFAHWDKIKYRIDLVTEHGSPPTNPITAIFDKTYSQCGLTNLTETGYLFHGWFTEPEGAGRQVNISDTVNATTIPELIDGKRTLYAYWTDNCTVNWFSNGGEWEDGATQQTQTGLQIGSKISEYSPAPEREGYTLGKEIDGVTYNWFTDETCTTPWNFSTNVLDSETTNLYAGWTIIPVGNTLYFDANADGATVDPSFKIHLERDQANLLDGVIASYTGYHLDGEFGWYTKSLSGTEVTNATKYSDLAPDPETTEVTIYAHWKPNEYTINANATGGEFKGEDPTTSLTYTYDGSAVLTSLYTQPEKEDYEFIGWFTAEDGGDEIESIDKDNLEDVGCDVSNPNIEGTVYAHWKYTKGVEVKFDPAPGHWEGGSQEVVTIAQPGGNWLVPDDNPEGSDDAPYFVIWYFTDKNTGLDVNVTKDVAFDEYALPEDNTVHAYYSATLSLTFDANGGWWDIEATQTTPAYKVSQKIVNQTLGAKYQKPADPMANTSVSFKGWSTVKEDPDLEHAFNLDQNVSLTNMPNPPILYAQYESGSWFKATFDANDGIDDNSHYWNYPVGTQTTTKQIIEITGEKFVLPQDIATIGPPLTNDGTTDVGLLLWNLNKTIQDPETEINHDTVVDESKHGGEHIIYAHYGKAKKHTIYIKSVLDSTDLTHEEDCILNIEGTSINITPSTSPYSYEYIDEPWQDPVYYNISTTLSESATVGHASFQRWYVTENVISSEATANVQFARFDLSTQEEGGEFPGWEGYLESEELWLTAHFTIAGEGIGNAYWIFNDTTSPVDITVPEPTTNEDFVLTTVAAKTIEFRYDKFKAEVGARAKERKYGNTVNAGSCPERTNDTTAVDWHYTTSDLTVRGITKGNVVNAKVDSSFLDAPMYSIGGMFDHMSKLSIIINYENIPVFNCSSLYGVFNTCYYLPSMDLSKWDTRSVKDMRMCFCNAFVYSTEDATLNLKNWDVRSCDKFDNMFDYDQKLAHIYVNANTNWTEKLTTTNVSSSYMFRGCKIIHNFYQPSTKPVYDITRAYVMNKTVSSSNTAGYFECDDKFDIQTEASPDSWGSVIASGIPAGGIQCDGTYNVSGNTITFTTFDGASAGSLTATPASDTYEFLKWTINEEDVISATGKVIKSNLKIVAWFKNKNDSSIRAVNLSVT